MTSTLQKYFTPDFSTTYQNEDGSTFKQLYQYYPFLSKFYFDFEKNFVAKPYVDFVRSTWPWLPILACVIYGAWIYFGIKWMKEREAYVLRKSFALWNLMLSLFSFMGMIRTVPHLINQLYRYSLEENICAKSNLMYSEGACGLWTMLFILSKLPELGDTIFLVHKKKPIIFLSWYHHMSVLVFCWHSYATQSSTGLFFVAMNYSIHAVMYGYFFLMTLKLRPSWFNPFYITLGQISQMIVGTCICIISYYQVNKEQSQCSVKRENVIAGAIMYGSYLYLFCDLFFGKYFRKSMNKKKDGKILEKKEKLK